VIRSLGRLGIRVHAMREDRFALFLTGARALWQAAEKRLRR
jgi:hypothetical protein